MISNHTTHEYTGIILERLRNLPQGGKMGDLPEHLQIGNAVPIRLAEAIAAATSRFLLSRKILGEIPVASYFSGAGGLDLGFENASSPELMFRTKFCTDIDKSCGHTIRLNRPQWNFLQGDITQFSGEVVLQHMGVNPIVVIGGPPCQPFSVAGKQKATTDPLGLLYRNYIEHVAFLEPEIVIMENVYGLKQVKKANVLGEITSAFASIGYDVKYRELLATDYGTPQARRRLIFVATKGMNDFVFPRPTHYQEGNIFGYPKYTGAGESFAHLPEPIDITKSPNKAELRTALPLRSRAADELNPHLIEGNTPCGLNR